MSCSQVRHGQAGAWHSLTMELLSQHEDQLGCDTTTAWSPASPTSFTYDLTSFSDAIQEAAALSDPTMHRGNHHRHRHSKTEPTHDRALMTTSAAYELDRDMMGMLANLNAGPPRAPVANWGFDPTSYDSGSALMGSSNQQTLTGSMMPSARAEMTHMMGMTSSNMPTTAQPPMGPPAPDAFVGLESGYVMPYQDCATLPVHDFPLYDNDMYKTAHPAQYAPHTMDNQLVEDSTPFFGNSGMPQAVNSTFQGAMSSSNETSLFNNVAQPPAATMTAINGGFAMPDLSLQEADDSDWNGSSSGFSAVSSSPIANIMNPMLSSSTTASMVTPRTTKSLTMNKDGSRKPKRIRRLCSVGGCGKRARSQDLCIAHGGGRRCMVEGCEKSSQGGNMCIKHGGGKRCKHPGCDKAAQTNSLCKAHGGGPRCQYPSCTKSSQGGGFCRAHGGGKRCAAQGCNKGTQRGDFCALHGGSRFCEVPGCMRNDRGGGFCAHHGGGKRCSIANCNRSCRRDGLCSTHLRLLGQDPGGSVPDISISDAMPTSTHMTSVWVSERLSEAQRNPELTVDTPGIMANALDAASL